MYFWIACTLLATSFLFFLLHETGGSIYMAVLSVFMLVHHYHGDFQ